MANRCSHRSGGGGETTTSSSQRVHLAGAGRGQPLTPWPAGLAVKRLEARSPRGLAYGGSHYQSLDSRRLPGGPGSGHARTPHPHRRHTVANKPTTPGSCATSRASPTAPARRSPTRTPPPRPAARSTGSSAPRPRAAPSATIERKQIADQIATGPVDDAPASARTRSPGAAAPPPGPRTASESPSRHRTARPPTAATPVIGERTELARYTRRRGRAGHLRPARSTASSASPTGPPARADAPTWSSAAWRARPSCDALVADYLAQAKRLDMPPLGAHIALEDLEAVA